MKGQEYEGFVTHRATDGSQALDGNERRQEVLYIPMSQNIISYSMLYSARKPRCLNVNMIDEGGTEVGLPLFPAKDVILVVYSPNAAPLVVHERKGLVISSFLSEV